MLSDMMHEDLNIIDILIYAAQIHPKSGLISYHSEERGRRQTYRETLGRVARLAHALRRIGISPGDRVGTIALNGIRHFEIYYATAAIGAVCHTINPRLSKEQLQYIVKHAEDKVILFDPAFRARLEEMGASSDDNLRKIALCENLSSLKDYEKSSEVLIYEDLLKQEEDTYAWQRWSDDTACSLCYTSGTTGRPKGALYSHKSCILEAMFVILGSGGSFKIGDRVLPIVPMFHVNAWGMPFIAPLTGCTLVMPGESMDGPALFEMMNKERVAQSWGVPTVYYGLLQEMKAKGMKPSHLTRVVMGGSAPSEHLLMEFEERFGVEALQGWGMTESNPVGSVGVLVEGEEELELVERVAIQASGSRRLFGVQMKIVGDDGGPLAQDGKTIGELCVKGPTVIQRYFKDVQASETLLDYDGWLRTGDMATITGGGVVTIVDRVKDLIKSGGEWISSIDMENKAAGYPGIYECAVIGVPDRKWGERPLLAIVLREGHQVDADALKTYLLKFFTKWQIPDKIIVRPDLPHTATGKVSKRILRAILIGGRK